MNVTHFEVYAYDRNRGWVLHARFPGQERETAVQEAKELEKMGFKSRVAREIYNTEENTYEESDIYVGRPKENAQAPSSPPPPRSSANKAPAKMSARGPALSKRKASSSSSSTPKISLSDVGESASKHAVSLIKSKAFTYIALISLAGLLAGVAVVKVMPNVITWLWNQGYHVDLRADAYDKILLAGFVGGFLLIAGPLALMLMPKMFAQKGETEPGEERNHQQEQVQEARRQKVRASLDSLSRQALMEESDEADSLASVANEEPPTTEAPQKEKEEKKEEKKEKPSAATPEDAATDANLAGSEAASKIRTFVDSAINAIKTTKTQLDNYNKFAVHLYIAGAVDVLGDAKNLVASERRRLTANALAALGTKGEMADQFYEKVREYTVEERYRKMVEYGRDAMEDFLKGAEASAHGQLTGAIQEWSRGATGTTASSTITVMFTDMVGSTDMTQDRGDVAAQEIVRRHNTIVRMAISQYGGKEIKHTGDGIMASFDDATGAVDASISIQRNVSSHNKARPDQPLLLRIGLNAGKPIQEENDIFGATVQLAARVCAATKPEQTLCTDSVQSRCRGRSDFIHSVGNHDLKGFKDPVPLFEVKW